MPLPDNPKVVENIIGIIQDKYPSIYNQSLAAYRDVDIRRNNWVDIAKDLIIKMPEMEGVEDSKYLHF